MAVAACERAGVAARFDPIHGLWRTPANSDVTSGRRGAIATVMLWLWVSSYAVLVGAALNAVMERERLPAP